MAKNAQLTIVEVHKEIFLSWSTFTQAEEIVPIGTLAPNAIYCSGTFIDRIVQCMEPKQFESVTAPPPPAKGVTEPKIEQSTRRRMARRVGIPTLVTEYIPSGIKGWLQRVNGILEVGAFPLSEDKADASVPTSISNADLLNS